MPQTEQGNTETLPQPVLWQGYKKKKNLNFRKNMTQLSERHAFKVNKIPVIKQTKENDCYSTYFVRPKQNFLQLVAISDLDSLFCFVS